MHRRSEEGIERNERFPPQKATKALATGSETDPWVKPSIHTADVCGRHANRKGTTILPLHQRVAGVTNRAIVTPATLLLVQTHRKGIYASKAEAFRQADKIGCTEVHENNGRWMPCADERELHQQMRRQ